MRSCNDKLNTVCKPSVLWFIAEIIGMITSRSISVMNCGKQVHDKEYIDVTIVFVANRIVIINFIRFSRIVL